MAVFEQPEMQVVKPGEEIPIKLSSLTVIPTERYNQVKKEKEENKDEQSI